MRSSTFGFHQDAPVEQFFGSLGATPLAHPIVSIAPSYNTVGQPNGYWMLDAGGTIYAFGAAWAPDRAARTSLGVFRHGACGR